MTKKNEYNDIGKKIENGVKEALFNGNWENLNSAITGSVDAVLDDVGDKINEKIYGNYHTGATPLSQRTTTSESGNTTVEWENRLRQEREQRRKAMVEEKRRREERKAAKAKNSSQKITTTALAFPYEKVGSVSSILYTSGGGIGLGITGAIALGNAIKLMVAGKMALAPFGSVLFFGGVFGMLLAVGISKSKLYKKAQRYVELIGNKTYIEINTLALLANKTPKQVLRDLRKMIKKGYFPQGHIDDTNTTFILTDSVFHQYLETKENAVRYQRDAVVDSTAHEVMDEYPGLSKEEAAELSSMISEGKAYIQKIHELNDIIPGEVISEKLYRLEGLLNEIFTRVKEHPEQMSKMHELMDYYLPTVVKIVGAYSEYDDISEPGEDIIKAKGDIENTLDTINDALSKLLNNLFKDSVWDVTTDAQVLKTVLAQKGLSDNT